MKILVLKPHLVARTNGGEICLLERLRCFQDAGAEVRIEIALNQLEKPAIESVLKNLGTPLKDISPSFGLDRSQYRVSGIRCEIAWSPKFDADRLDTQPAFHSYFHKILNQETPDLVWSHYTDYFSTTAALLWNPERAWIDVSDNEYPRPSELKKYPRLAAPYSFLKNIMVASPFMEREVKKDFPQARVRLLPNLIEALNQPPLSYRRSDAWVFVNPVEVKGFDFVVRLAQRLPEERFLIVSNWMREKPENLPSNMNFISRQESLRDVLVHAKGVLMPSQWEEAFGRIPLEAMAAGVPVIVSPRGALPETVGTGALVVETKEDLWIAAMRRIAAGSQSLIQSGFSRVESYKAECDRIYDALKNELNLVPSQVKWTEGASSSQGVERS